ncbi:hypothetical protein AVEN_3934-1 [Araneus ventricosus]|uniref:Uncharacterized protein n=1 Tax=Araneus ventricosus TaxID=182803 RepID=A0A4Y2TTD0_ARAVE|nr:hypothetical protein AVEN_3934-1 [Araneus ventricosus]
MLLRLAVIALPTSHQRLFFGIITLQKNTENVKNILKPYTLNAANVCFTVLLIQNLDLPQNHCIAVEPPITSENKLYIEKMTRLRNEEERGDHGLCAVFSTRSTSFLVRR